MAAGTFTVRGHRIRSQSNRRFIVVQIYQAVSPSPPYGKVEKAQIYKRSDSIQTCRAHIQRYGFWAGSYMVIVDTTTGEEV
jgi:hypothetical protein